ncbi:MAG: ribosome silencing factor [Bacteroidales bacterium]|nr:ribosome silencing factor [Bacteroidales bacterium]
MIKETKESLLLSDLITEAMLSKKASNIVVLNLQGVENSVCDCFIICSGNSLVHIQTLRDSIIHEVRKAIKEKPWHVEGNEKSEWLLIDYTDVVVHIFLDKTRKFYGIEDLWADAEITSIEDKQ